jgi:hypothetical protein
MQYLLAAAQASVLFVLWSRRKLGILKFFALSLVASLPIVFGYRPNSSDWIAEIYYRLEPLVLFLRLAAGAEAMYRLLPRKDRGQVLLTTGAVSLPVPAVAWLLAGHPTVTFVLFRRYAQVFELFALLVACVYVWRVHGLIGWRWGILERHLAVLTAICANHATVSAIGLHLIPGWSYLGWYAAQNVSWTVAAALYASWSVLIIRTPQRASCQVCQGAYTSL